MASFAWKASYFGCVAYTVTDETGTYEAELRHSVSAYELSIANGDDVRREMASAVGILRRHNLTDNGRWFEIPAATVKAFNAWRLAERSRILAEMKAAPDRYGEIDESDPFIFPPLIPARAGFYESGRGWQLVEGV